MKPLIKRAFMVVLTVTCALTVMAQQFKAIDPMGNTLSYSVNQEGTTATLTGAVTMQSNILIAPNIVSYNGRNYKVTSIKDRAFATRQDLEYAYIYGEDMIIGQQAFALSGLQFVELNGVKTIGAGSFIECENLRVFKANNTLEVIGASAFEDCKELQDFSLPESVVEVGSRAFTGVRMIDAVYNSHLFAYLSPNRHFMEYIVPEGIKTIAPTAFRYCIDLTKVIIPNSVTTVGNDAFQNTNIDEPVYNDKIFAYLPTSYNGEYRVPSGITTICPTAFHDCNEITDIVIPKSVNSISPWAFWNCEKLESVTILNVDVNIDGRSFYNCPTLKGPVILGRRFIHMPTSFVGEYLIPDDVDELVPFAFQYSNLSSIVIPESVTKMDNTSIFRECKQLESIVLPNNLTKLARLLFSYDTNLKNINLPNSLKEIGIGTFIGCGLTSINIPSNVSKIDNIAR